MEKNIDEELEKSIDELMENLGNENLLEKPIEEMKKDKDEVYYEELDDEGEEEEESDSAKIKRLKRPD